MPSARDLMGKTITPTNWAVPDLIPAGVTFMVAPPKSGKSLFMLALANAVASGTPAFSSLPTLPGDVLYVSLEDNEEELQSRLRRLLGDDLPPAHFHYECEWRRLHAGGLADVERWIIAHPRARLVILDMWALVKNPGAKNDYDGTYAQIRPVKELGEKYGVGIVIVHHTKKKQGRGSGDPLEDTLGSQALVGSADAVLCLERERGSERAQLFATGKRVKDQWLDLRFNEGDWQVVKPGQLSNPGVAGVSPATTPQYPGRTWGDEPRARKGLARLGPITPEQSRGLMVLFFLRARRRGKKIRTRKIIARRRYRYARQQATSRWISTLRGSRY